VFAPWIICLSIFDALTRSSLKANSLGIMPVASPSSCG